MDKMVYTALNSLRLLIETETVTSTNLSNATTTGFRKDTTAAFSTVYQERNKQLDPRAFASVGQRTFDAQSGELIRTDNPLDIAVDGAGWFLVTPPGGSQNALSRRGDLYRDIDGFIRSGDDALVLDVNGAPITLPDYREIEIGNDGTINIIPLAAGPEEIEFQVIGRVGIYNDAGILLEKDEDSYIRPVNFNDVPPADPFLRLKQGFIERSNVIASDELVSTLELARLYEVNVNMITTAEELDRSSSVLLRID